jgi:hypothetical protein
VEALVSCTSKVPAYHPVSGSVTHSRTCGIDDRRRYELVYCTHLDIADEIELALQYYSDSAIRATESPRHKGAGIFNLNYYMESSFPSMQHMYSERSLQWQDPSSMGACACGSFHCTLPICNMYAGRRLQWQDQPSL